MIDTQWIFIEWLVSEWVNHDTKAYKRQRLSQLEINTVYTNRDREESKMFWCSAHECVRVLLTENHYFPLIIIYFLKEEQVLGNLDMLLIQSSYNLMSLVLSKKGI